MGRSIDEIHPGGRHAFRGGRRYVRGRKHRRQDNGGKESVFVLLFGKCWTCSWMMIMGFSVWKIEKWVCGVLRKGKQGEELLHYLNL